MIDALSAKVKSSDERAIKIGVRVYPLIKDRGLPALRLARRYGFLATLYPRMFLQVMKPVNGLDRTLLLATIAEAVGNPIAQQDELQERRNALSTVNDPSLKTMCNADIVLLDAAVIRLNSDDLHPIPEY